MRVHVVEDDERLRGSLTRLLGAAGYLVMAWPDADAAVAAMTGGSLVEVVLADGLRTRDGDDLLDALLAAGTVAVAVRFGLGAEGPPHALEVIRLRMVGDSAAVLSAVARATSAAHMVNAGLAAAGLLPGDVDHVTGAA